MYCIMCGRLGDYHPSGYCIHCRRELDRRNRHDYALSLLKDSYPYVPKVKLREKIEEFMEMEDKRL